MDRILCSIDLSPASHIVVQWAAMLAAAQHRPLLIFHAIHQPSDQIHPSTEFEHGGGLYARRRQSMAAIEAFAQSLKVPWQADIAYGDPAEMIQQYCQTHGVAAVVSGSKGFTGVKRLFMGTVVERLARMLPCPLLVIRPAADAMPEINTIAVSCDGSDACEALVGYASDLALTFSSRLQLLHVMASAVEISLVEPTDGPYGEVQHRLQARWEDHLAAMIPETDRYAIFASVHLAAGQVKDELPALIETLQPDLLMVGVRPRRTLGQWMTGSSTEVMLRKAPCHVMVVPETYLEGAFGAPLKTHPASDNPPTGIVRDDAFLAHRSDGDHPENHRRLESIYAMLDEVAGAMPLIDIVSRSASMEELAMVHSRAYVNQIAATAQQAYSQLTADTYACRDSFEAARRSAGGVMAAIDDVLKGAVRNAFVMVRPPGHHAEIGRAGGFCLFNNVALGAEYARMVKGLKKVMIVDWDLHHGNGTQHIFEADPAVLYISTHQYPCFPGTGHHLEVGRGRGEGFTINLALGKGWKDGDYVMLFQRLVAPVALAFAPDLILVSAGFDTHKKDPLGRMRMTEAGFTALTRILMDVARTCCRDRLVLVLEGGYHIKALASSVHAVLAELCDLSRADPDKLVATAKKRRVEPVLRRMAHMLGHVWPCLRNPDRQQEREVI